MTAIAASGMRARLESLDLLANNLANASTRGYKADREIDNLYTAGQPSAPGANDSLQQPWVNQSWIDFSQGTLEPTGSPLDVALQGKGFLTMRGTSGPVYTRDGALHLSSQGVLLGPENRVVLDDMNKQIQVDPSKPFTIDPDGNVVQDGQPLAKLAIVEFPKPDELTKTGQSYFQPAGKDNAPHPATNTEVRQGQEEESNTGPAEAAVQLVTVMRQFEMLQKATIMSDDMDKQAISQVAKVGQ